jgi:hypothetical protein
MSNLDALNNAAGRALNINARPASDKQIKFMASLMEQTGTTAEDMSLDILTTKIASGFIDAMLNKSRKVADQRPGPNVPCLKKVHAMVAKGREHLKWPKVIFADANIKLSLAGERAKVPGSVNVTSNDGFRDSTWYGRILEDGTMTASRHLTPEVEAFLTLIADNPEDAVANAGKHSGNCCFCSKPLTDPASLDAGYGPTCAKHFGLPH